MGSVSVSNCNECLSGWYCPENGQADYVQYPAYPGYYIENMKAETLDHGCPPGTYLPTDESRLGDDCINCGAAFYCPQFNMSAPIACEEGTEFENMLFTV